MLSYTQVLIEGTTVILKGFKCPQCNQRHDLTFNVAQDGYLTAETVCCNNKLSFYIAIHEQNLCVSTEPIPANWWSP